ncbi:MAG: GNAT family N-acetyltransferase [Ilumatobacteraceae bacterium]
MTVQAEIRLAQPADRAAVLGLMEDFCGVEGKRFDVAIARAGLDPLLESDRYGAVLVAVEDGVVSAYAVVCWSWSVEIGGAEACLDEIYVTRRGGGVGSALIDAVRELCLERGMRRIFLETEAPNDAARRLYARHGFTAEDSIWMAALL